MLTSILAFLVAISVLIFVHELGHLVAAKLVGIDAPRFSIGFGPRVWGFHWRGTEYVISAIPMGGYVKMAGMEDDEAAEVLEGGGQAPRVDPERTFDSKPIWARTLVISAGVVMNMAFAVVAYFAISAIWGEQVIDTTRVLPDTAATGVAAQVLQIPEGARITAVGDRPVTDFMDLQQALQRAPSGPVQLHLAERAPVALDLPESLEDRFAIMMALHPMPEGVVNNVLRGSPAEAAGLQVHDRIVAVQGRPVRGARDLIEVLRANPGNTLELTVEREDVRIPVPVTPRTIRERVDGEEVEIGQIGANIGPPITHRSVGLGEATVLGFTRTWETTDLILTTLRQLFTGTLSPRNLGGLITIGEASGESARMGPLAFLSFLALLSVNLAILNLLPIPVLDGGHLMFLLVEAVRGRPLSLEARLRLSHVGLLIVIGLMLWANGNDVVRLVERYLGG